MTGSEAWKLFVPGKIRYNALAGRHRTVDDTIERVVRFALRRYEPAQPTVHPLCEWSRFTEGDRISGVIESKMTITIVLDGCAVYQGPHVGARSYPVGNLVPGGSKWLERTRLTGSGERDGRDVVLAEMADWDMDWASAVPVVFDLETGVPIYFGGESEKEITDLRVDEDVTDTFEWNGPVDMNWRGGKVHITEFAPGEITGHRSISVGAMYSAAAERVDFSSIEEAIDWGRSLSDWVLVRRGAVHYSAGATSLPDIDSWH